MDVPLNRIGETWRRAIAGPIPPRVVEQAPCQEIVLIGDDLQGDGNGLDALPIPISTPGFDSAPYMTATCCITADPETGRQNMGTYRAGLKAPDRLAVKMFVNLQQGGFAHWQRYRERGEKMPMAIVLGSPPVVAYCGPQKLPEGVDEIAVAGGLAGVPIEVLRARTVDLLVPAQSEIVIEGLVDTEFLEPEGPFGESHGHVNLEEYNLMMTVTAITRRRDAIVPSIISQVTPSESSVIKRVAYEPLFLEHLRDHLGIKGVIRVSMHEPLTNLRRVIVVQVEREVPETEVWRALYGASSFQRPCGKYVIAVNEDIDPDNGDAVFWAMSYRADPEHDTHLLRHKDPGRARPRRRNPPSSSTQRCATTHPRYRCRNAATWKRRRNCGNGSTCHHCAPKRRGTAIHLGNGTTIGRRLRNAPPTAITSKTGASITRSGGMMSRPIRRSPARAIPLQIPKRTKCAFP